jgi:excisionase family DNA binding protein
MPLDKAAYSIAEVARLSGLGRSSIYKAIQCGELKARKFGRRTMILAVDLSDWFDSLTCVPANPDQ